MAKWNGLNENVVSGTTTEPAKAFFQLGWESFSACSGLAGLKYIQIYS
jgi:hypothetical protein